MNGIEWWVVRVMIKPLAGERSLVRVDGETDVALVDLWFAPELGRAPTVAEWRKLQHDVEIGKLHKLPDNSIGEPLEGFTTEGDAQAWYRAAQLTHPNQEFRVCMVAPIDATFRGPS